MSTEEMLDDLSIPVKRHNGTIDDTALNGANVLVIGNAWGDYSKDEITSIKKFVKNGGAFNGRTRLVLDRFFRTTGLSM